MAEEFGKGAAPDAAPGHAPLVAVDDPAPASELATHQIVSAGATPGNTTGEAQTGARGGRRRGERAPRARSHRGRRAPMGWKQRLRVIATETLITAFAALMVASVAVSLIQSDWMSFNPVSGIGVLGQMPFQPQGFGDGVSLPLAPTTVPNTPGQSISLQYRPSTPTSKPGVQGSGSGGVVGGAAWSGGTWTGGVGQGCVTGAAPSPANHVIYNARSYGISTNEVALTFDDGPTPSSSLPIISYLEQTHTPATFFVLGQYARAYPWLVQREASDGFAIGIHTWDHPDMVLLSPAQRAWELQSTINQLHADLGGDFCAWLWRPPYGAVNSGIVGQAGSYGLTTINWDVDPQDWSRPGVSVIVSRVLSQVRPGSIILMHDGPAAREQTAAALPYILAGLHQRGLIPVTVPTLLHSGSAPTGGPTATATPNPTATVGPTATPAPTATAAPAPTDTPVPSPTATTTSSPTTGASPSPIAVADAWEAALNSGRWLMLTAPPPVSWDYWSGA